ASPPPFFSDPLKLCNAVPRSPYPQLDRIRKPRSFLRLKLLLHCSRRSPRLAPLAVGILSAGFRLVQKNLLHRLLEMASLKASSSPGACA
ncbi:hypothetical protein U1Q18_039329, partial [Sarracenia purpurea var. burkii]